MKHAHVLLLALMAALMWHSAGVESQTYDEAVHLVSGYSYWRTGDFRLNPEHPPLSKLAQALPLLPLSLDPPHGEAWQRGDASEAGRLFVHHNQVPAARLLTLGRTVTLALTLLLGFAIWFWTSSVAGPYAALIAVFLFTMDPNFIAHGHYVTSDIAVALAIFASAVTWLRYVESPTWRGFLWAALALGIALATKFSALYLLPVHFGAALLLRPHRRTVARWLAVSAASLVVLALSYGPATLRAFQVNPRKPLATLRDNHPYAIGVKTLAAHNDERQPAYLLGEVYRGGKWQYFPVAFLVKTPVAALLAFLLIPLLIFYRGHGRLLLLLLYPAAYLLLTMQAGLNIGHRHLLPMYPFLFALAGIAFSHLTRFRRPLLAAIAAFSLFETARIHPDHTAFFNALAGGPDNGETLLLDSNLDWGQDLGKLKAFLAAHGTDTAAIQYFGGVLPADYGIREQGLPITTDPYAITHLDAWAAISLTLLHDVYYDKPAYTWLRQRKPTARIGRSIYVYDLRKAGAR